MRKGEDFMNIQGLPIAVNYAQPNSKLTQYTGKIQQTTSGSHADHQRDDVKFCDTLIASDKDYTKESAILKQWNKAGSFNIYDVMNGEPFKLQNPQPMEEELLEFEKSLQKNGLSDEINWIDFQNDLAGIGFSTDSPVFRLDSEDFQRKTEYLASRYAAMEDKIKQHFSGAEQDAHMQKLDDLYQGAVKEVAKGYAEVVGGFLEENGMSGEKEKIYHSVINSVNDRIDEYRTYLSENKDPAGLKGTKDEWLVEDDAYIAAILRQSNMGRDIKETDSESYTFDELNVCGKYAAELTAFERKNSCYATSEEQVGLDFAMLAMKTEELFKRDNDNPALKNLLQKMVSGFMNHYLERMDNKLADLRENAACAADIRGYQALDRQSVWNVYNRTLEEYKHSGNAMEALEQGAKYALGQINKKTGNDIYRYQNVRLYANDFFAAEAAASYTSVKRSGVLDVRG